MEMAVRVYVKPNPWVGGWDVLVLNDFENYQDDIERYGAGVARRNYAIMYIRDRRDNEKHNNLVTTHDRVGRIESLSLDQPRVDRMGEQQMSEAEELNVVTDSKKIVIEMCYDRTHGLMCEIIMIAYVLLAIFSPFRWLTIVAVIFAVENLIESIYFSFKSAGYRLNKNKKEENGLS